MKNVMGRFPERLRELRNDCGIKQSDVAELLGCTTGHYQKIEYGMINIPTLSLVKLADYFDVTLDYLMGRSDKRKE